MDNVEFRRRLAELSIRQVDFARLVDVSSRAVNMWATGERAIPGPAGNYLRLLSELPAALQARELARLREENPVMLEGMYSFNYAGKDGSGIGLIVLSGGHVFGSDGGVQYDGSYAGSVIEAGCIDLHLVLTVPPGVPLVTGVPPQPAEYRFPLALTVKARADTNGVVQTPYGSVSVAIRFLRDIPRDLAA